MTSLEERNRILGLANEAITAGARKKECCDILNISIRTLERWEKNNIGDQRQHVKKNPKNKLSKKERNKIIEICCSPEYRDKTPNEIVPLLAEKGKYYGSEATFYRVLKEENLLNHRSETMPRKSRKKPEELKANGPNQVWSWDITYLLSAIKGKYFYLYMYIDIWSRKIVGWAVHESENSEKAAELVKNICNSLKIDSINLHMDNGKPMKGATMLATLQSLGVIPSFSRPHVSDDNPYSESLFKTLKYLVGYPKAFETIEMARNWIGGFVHWYNNEHLHSGIKYVTPGQRHSGEDKIILQKREETYNKAKFKNPERWAGNIKNFNWIECVTLNPNMGSETKKVA